MSLPPIVFLFSCLSLGMTASFTPFLEYGPPPAGVLHLTLREEAQQPQLGSNKPCLGHPNSAQPYSQQPQIGSNIPCSGQSKFALPCSRQPCSEQQPNFEHLDNKQPSFGQPRTEQLQTTDPVEHPKIEHPLQVSPEQPIVMVRDGMGQYSVGHEVQGPDGQRVSEQGQLITTNGGWEYVIAKKGSYSYTSPEGILVSVDWEADHNGFRIINSTV